MKKPTSTPKRIEATASLNSDKDNSSPGIGVFKITTNDDRANKELEIILNEQNNSGGPASDRP